jgi:hypothetical protein
MLLLLQVAAIKQGTTLVLECRRQRRYDQAALTASEKMLKVVPEVRGPSSSCACALGKHSFACAPNCAQGLAAGHASASSAHAAALSSVNIPGCSQQSPWVLYGCMDKRLLSRMNKLHALRYC